MATLQLRRGAVELLNPLAEPNRHFFWPHTHGNPLGVGINYRGAFVSVAIISDSHDIAEGVLEPSQKNRPNIPASLAFAGINPLMACAARVKHGSTPSRLA